MLINFLLLVFLLIGLGKELVLKKQINQKITNLEQESAFLEEKNSALIGLMSKWQSQNQLEKEARIKLGLKKPGEKVVVVTDGRNESGDEVAPIDATAISAETDPVNYLKWWRYFIGDF